MQILMFHSYKGGSGKSILSINVANQLVGVYNKKVLLIEADFSMPSFQKIFTDNNPDVFFNDYLNQDKLGLVDYIYPNNKERMGIIYCNTQFSSKDKVHGVDQSWFLTKIEQIRKDLKKLDYDYVIFDLSPGFHFFTVSGLMLSDSVIVVLRPDYHSYMSTKDLISRIYSKAVNAKAIKIYLLFNQIPNYNKIQSVVDEWANQLESEFPIFEKITQFMFHNETNYHSAIQKTVLPEGDPLLNEIKIFLGTNLI